MAIYSTPIGEDFALSAAQHVSKENTDCSFLHAVLIFTDYKTKRAFMEAYHSINHSAFLAPQVYVLSKLKPEDLAVDGLSQNPTVVNEADHIILQAALWCQESNSESFAKNLSHINFIWGNLANFVNLSTIKANLLLEQWLALWRHNKSQGLVQAAQALQKALSRWPEFSFDTKMEIISKQLERNLDTWTRSGQRVYLIGMLAANNLTASVVRKLLELKQDILAPYVPRHGSYEESSIAMDSWTDYYLSLWRLFALPENCFCTLLPRVSSRELLLSTTEWVFFPEFCCAQSSAHSQAGSLSDVDNGSSSCNSEDCKPKDSAAGALLHQVEWENEYQEILFVTACIVRELNTTPNHVRVLVSSDDYATRLQYMLAAMDISTSIKQQKSISKTPDGRAFLAVMNFISDGATMAALCCFCKQSWIQGLWSEQWRQKFREYEIAVRKGCSNIQFIPTYNAKELKPWLEALVSLLKKCHTQYKRCFKVNLGELLQNQLRILLLTAQPDWAEQMNELMMLSTDAMIAKLGISCDLAGFVHRMALVVHGNLKMLPSDWFVYLRNCANKEKVPVNKRVGVDRNDAEKRLTDDAEKRLTIEIGLKSPCYSSDTVICTNVNSDNGYMDGREIVSSETMTNTCQQSSWTDVGFYRQQLVNMSIFRAKKVIMTRAEQNMRGQETMAHQLWFFVKIHAHKHNLSLEVDQELKEVMTLISAQYEQYYREHQNLKSLCLPKPCPAREFRQNEISITNIKYLWRNPYVIFAKRVLKLPTLLDLTMKPGHQDRGLCFHTIMEKFWQQPKQDIDTFHMLLNTVLRKWSREHMLRFLWQNQFQRFGDWLVRYLVPWYRKNVKELKAESHGASFIPDLQLKIRGKADAIYCLHGNGGFGVIDYKTGNPPSAISVRERDEQQLPIEGLMLSLDLFKKQDKSQLLSILDDKAKETNRVVRLTYIGMKGNFWQEPKCSSFDLLAESNLLQNSRERLKEILSGFYAQNGPLRSYNAIDNTKKDCTEIQYAQLMRIEVGPNDY